MDLSSVLSPYRLQKEQLDRIMSTYESEFGLGLKKSPPDATVAMLPSFIPVLPDGSEKGKFLGLDLGGTNLRVIYLEIIPGQPLKLDSKSWSVSQEAMTGTGEQLFDFVVDKLTLYLSEKGLRTEKLSLGFVFSYPCDQIGLRQAKLLWWTKGFSCTDTIGMDVVQMLQDAIERKGDLKVKVQAIMNDTVGHLVASAYEHGPRCRLAVILSTGCNAAFMEKTERISKFDSTAMQYSFPEMIIDTEWEEFGNKGQLDLIKTDIDKEIDLESVHVGKNTQDKYVAGMHLGEHVRKLLLHAISKGFITAPNGLRLHLNEPFSFKSEYVSQVLSENVKSSEFLSLLGVHEPSEQLFGAIREICETVSNRSAGILAAAIAALMKEMNWPSDIKIGFSGSLYKHHPTFKQLLESWLSKLVPDNVKYSLVYTEDSSAKGAALVAAIVEKMGI